VKFIFHLKRPHRILQWPRRILFTAGAAMLGYCAFVWLDTAMFQQREGRQLDRMLAERPLNVSRAVAASSVSGEGFPAPLLGGLLGRIEIPRLGISAILIEGTSKTTLRRAVGHISGTAMPGEPGNAGISGHRDTFFRPLRKIQQNDVITLITLRGEFRYRVAFSKVVPPSDTGVLESVGGETLTLITCYPFYFVGAAPDRFVIRAERIDESKSPASF
jgi:sortase A